MAGTQIKLLKGTVPPTPTTGMMGIYPDSNGVIHKLDDTGVDTQIVDAAAAQTIGGVKTFSSAPVFSAGITGVTDGSSAAAGKVGDIISNSVTMTNPVPGQWDYSAAPITLTPGDWDVECNAEVQSAAAWSLIGLYISMSISAQLGGVNGLTIMHGAIGSAYGGSAIVPRYSISVSVNTTLYPWIYPSGTGNGTVYVYFQARRVR